MTSLAKTLSTIALLAGLVAAGIALAPVNSARAVEACSNTDWKPVCGMVGTMKRTFSNACWAKANGATKTKAGECKW